MLQPTQAHRHDLSETYNKTTSAHSLGTGFGRRLWHSYVRDTHLEGASFEQAAEEPAIANGFREPRMQRIPRIDHDFHVNKIPIVAVTEGRGAQDMVALVLGRKIG